ncbi:hypothetical protein E2C01_082109 [Portunus trituberculatus]|uniref:Uncharacterized protein n=1 Tax=Portunus trituberculatus TaxID=210409 RepID=A0A5B7ITN0_PORTR|nr:hypothetical protein [Portunus trituberculatus]
MHEKKEGRVGWSSACLCLAGSPLRGGSMVVVPPCLALLSSIIHRPSTQRSVGPRRNAVCMSALQPR